MQTPAPLPPLKKLSDYRAPDWLVPEMALDFQLNPDRTLVRARLRVERNGQHDQNLRLDGEDLELLELRIDGEEQPLPNWQGDVLELALSGDRAIVETLVAIHPAANSRLMGLYASGGILCTQCEAEGFRRITFFPDRPDILCRYKVRLEADATRYPVLLANGNTGKSGDLPDGRHFAEWEDPFPKPSYLFALVAGQLSALKDSFTTASGRKVKLAIWVAERDVPRCRHAMESLKASMAWDEQVYGREYDLDEFNIVAVHDFNFGAMENKGLNIFNAKYVLADPETATDADFDAISAIVAHEYFHNWSGNRVTCRDWFQLSLKEGFTVFRDQQFSADRGSAAVKRIESVRQLRATQFPEDAGPLAHPVRPESYMEISNFYTATVYDKGAELIRMMARQLGPSSFRRATDRYFAANDGRAATVEDFLAAMAAEGLDSALFKRWYEQPGTPQVAVSAVYDAENARVDLRFSQSNTRAGEGAPPLPIPLRFAAFASDGRKLLERDDLVLVQKETHLALEGMESLPILSLNRGFAAPINVAPAPSRADLLLLAAHEDDPFARYEAVQQLLLSALLESTEAGALVGADDVVRAFSSLLDGWKDDPAFVAETLLIPAEALVGDRMRLVDPAAIHTAREEMRLAIVHALGPRLWEIWRGCQSIGTDISPRAKGLRRLKGLLLSLLMAGDSPDLAEAAFAQFENADCMTDRMSALVALSHSSHPQREQALALFHSRYRHLPEVLDKWFLAQAGSARADTLDRVMALSQSAEFDPRNPNRLRSLVMGFTGNHPRFHEAEGRGYAFLCEQVLAADRINPQSAARLIQPLARWRRFAQPWGGRMQQALQKVAESPGISPDLTEVVTTGLK